MAEQTTHHQRLAHYQQRYIQALSQGFDLSPLVREELDSLQQRLGLSNDDVERVKWFVQHGNLHQPSLPQGMHANTPLAPSPSPLPLLSGDKVRPQPDIYSSPQQSGAGPTPQSQSFESIPPGALPLTPNMTQLQDSTAIPAESIPAEPLSAGSIPAEDSTSAASVPTLFNLSAPSSESLSTAPVVPTPIGLSPANGSSVHQPPLVQGNSSIQDNQPTLLYQPAAPHPLKEPDTIDLQANASPSHDKQLGREQNDQPSPDLIDQIEQEALQKRIEQYEVAFVAAIARQFPVSERDRQALHHLQHLLDLSDNQVRHINQRIVDQVNQKEAYYHHTKIQTYAQQFVKFLEQDWPLSSSSRAVLTQLQTQLELHDADVQALEHQMAAQHLAKATAPLPQDPAPNTIQPRDSGSAAHVLDANPGPSNSPEHPQEYEKTELMPGMGTIASESTLLSPTPDLVQSETIQEKSSAASISPEHISSEHVPPAPLSQPDVSAAESTTQSFNLEYPSSVASSSESSPVASATILEAPGLLPTELESPDHNATASPPAVSGYPAPAEPPAEAMGSKGASSSPSFGVQLLTEREIDYGQLETYLKTQKWKEADEETLDMMCKATSRRVAWLDRQAISDLPCTDLKTIDALWYQYSNGKFGFRVQQEIFKATQANHSNVALFGQKVGWTIWQSKWVGFKYYKQLTFALSAPPGHLPAKWFWMVPWWESVRSGGLGTGRGGCGGDASEMLEAMMLYKSLD